MSNKIIAMLRKTNGDSIECAIRCKDRLFTLNDFLSLRKKIDSKIKPFTDDALYYTIRLDINDKKDNYKVKTFDGLICIIDELEKINVSEV